MKAMKKLIMTLLACTLATALSAQIDKEWQERVRQSMDSARREYEDFRQKARQSYADFRRQANEEYARFMADPWAAFAMEPVIPIHMEPKPPQPIRVDPDDKPIPRKDPIIFDLQPLPDHPYEQPVPIEPIVPNPSPDVPMNYITFYGTSMGFHFDRNYLPRMDDNSEKSVSGLWYELSDDYFDNLVAECLSYRGSMNLCDWAYFQMTRQLAHTYFGQTNEAAVLHMYLLVQSGYQTRIASKGNRLYVLMATDDTVYSYGYINIEGKRYFIFDKDAGDGVFYVYDHAFPSERMMSFAAKQPKLSVAKTAPRSFGSGWMDIEATVVLNQNLIDFFNDYPLSSHWVYYSVASLSDMAKESLYPAMLNAIEGKSQVEAAGILLTFMQFAFEYATDQEQFGYERPLFPDESLFYPYNDCEDRSIFYACLVSELLGLDVVLLHYPGHLATAVCFNEAVVGDYLMLDGKRYVVCDPTYIGANVGMCMPKFVSIKPNVVRF